MTIRSKHLDVVNSLLMETLQELVFVEPSAKEGIVCRQTKQPNAWLETAYSLPEQVVDMNGIQIPLSEIFANLPDE